MLDILLNQMEGELDDMTSLLGEEAKLDLIPEVVAEYDLNWMDTKFCIARLHHRLRGTMSYNIDLA